MSPNEMISGVLNNAIVTRQAVADAYNTVDPELVAMCRTFLKKSKGQPEGVVNLCAQDLGFKLAEFMKDR